MNSCRPHKRHALPNAGPPLRITQTGRTVASRRLRLAVCGLTLWTVGAPSAVARPESAATSPATAAKPAPEATKPAPAPVAEARFDIDEFRVEGADSMPQIEIEAAVYPFLGPHRTAQDVEKARAAVEKAYHDKGLQTVSVTVPQQDAQRGFVVLKVSENRVACLRVKGSRYFDLDKIKRSGNPVCT